MTHRAAPPAPATLLGGKLAPRQLGSAAVRRWRVSLEPVEAAAGLQVRPADRPVCARLGLARGPFPPATRGPTSPGPGVTAPGFGCSACGGAARHIQGGWLQLNFRYQRRMFSYAYVPRSVSNLLILKITLVSEIQL